MATGDVDIKLNLTVGKNEGDKALSDAREQADALGVSLSNNADVEARRLNALLDANDARKRSEQDSVKALENQRSIAADLVPIYASAGKEAQRMADSFAEVQAEAEAAARAANGINQFGGVGNVPFGPQPSSTRPSRGVNNASVASTLSELLSGSDAGRIVNTAADASRLISQLGNLSGGFIGLATAIGPLVIGAAAVAGALAIMNAELAEAAKSANESSQALIRQREANREIRDEQLTTLEIQERLKEAQQAEADAKADLATQTGILNQTFTESQRLYGDLGAKVGTFAANLGGSFNTINEDIEASRTKLIDARADIRAYTAALDDNSGAIGDLIEQEKKLADQRKAAAASLSGIAERTQDILANALEASGQRLEDRSIRFRDAFENNLIDGIDQFIDRSIAAKDATEDLNRSLEQQAAAQEARLTKIQADGNERIAKLRADAVEKADTAAQQVAEIEENARKEQLAARVAFNREQERADRKALLSKLEALNAGDFGAIARITRDREEERRNAREDFRSERNDRQDASRERAAEIQREIVAFQAQTNSRIRIEQEATRQAIESAQTEYTARLALDAEARRIQSERAERDSALAEGRAERDSKRAAEREERDFLRSEARITENTQKQLDAIKKQRDAQFALYADAQRGINQTHATQMANEAAYQASLTQTSGLLDAILDANARALQAAGASPYPPSAGGSTGVSPVAPPAGALPPPPPLRPAFPLTPTGGLNNRLASSLGAGSGRRSSTYVYSADGMFRDAHLNSVTPEMLERVQEAVAEAVGEAFEQLDNLLGD